MNKKVILGILLTALALAFLMPVYRMLTEGDSEEMSVQFRMEDQQLVADKKKLRVQIVVNTTDVTNLSLTFNDSLLKEWKSPKGTLFYDFVAGPSGLGTGIFELKAQRQDGQLVTDSRTITVVSDIIPEKWSVKVEKEFPHNSMSFTQGLEFNQGNLYEGTGQNGSSLVARVNLESGNQELSTPLDAQYFGEGISVLGNSLYQITWQQQKCFVYDKQTLKQTNLFNYSGEGWGLCNDGKVLIMSDGSHRLTFRDPKTFNVLKVVEVFSNKGPVEKLNELEFMEGLVYANVWMTTTVVVIDPLSGKVKAEIDARELSTRKGPTGDVLNGIAYNSQKKKWYMTGKNWPKLFEVVFKKPGITD
jgi:glutamine cyclotransferase